jgi:hypothetical protein
MLAVKDLPTADTLQGPQASVANSFQDNSARMAKNILPLREKIRPLCKTWSFIYRFIKIRPILNHFRVGICDNSSFFIHSQEKVKATTLFQIRPLFGPFW